MHLNSFVFFDRQDVSGICMSFVCCRDDMETKEELDNLLEESTMPLKSLLAQYDSPLQEKSKGNVL